MTISSAGIRDFVGCNSFGRAMDLDAFDLIKMVIL